MKKKQIIFISIAALLLAGMIWLIWGNVTVGLSQYEILESNLPAAFDGYRIAHISDLHNSWLWKQSVDQLQKAQPDMICITGDVIDCKKTDVEVALAFAQEAVKIAPCYYITGNHEINAGHILLGEADAAVNDDDIVLEFNQSNILSDLAESAQRNNF